MELMAAFPREHRLSGVLFDYPSLVLAIVVTYLVFVLKIGPEFMRNRRPFNLRMVTRIFDVYQVFANLVFVVSLTRAIWPYRHSEHFRLPCIVSPGEHDLDDKGDTEYLFSLSTMYLFVRMTDFLETMMFILMKKSTHVSFLHIYHHIAVVLTGYIYIRSGWGSLIMIGSIINASIHVVMYTYYFLATFPSMRPHLWWKRHLTLLQIIQFVTFGTYMIWVYFGNCGYPDVFIYYIMAQVIIFFALFSKFYTENYLKKKKAVSVAESASTRKND